MTKKLRRSSQKAEPAAALPAVELPPQNAKVVVIEYLRHPPKGSIKRTIHPRRYAPVIPQGEPISDQTPSPAVVMQPALP
jgi:hypothetical protein